MKLQLMSHEVNDAIESATAELVAAVPKSTAEMETIASEAASLRLSLEDIVSDLSEIDRRNHGSVHFLSEVDRIKGRLDSCSQVLSEAEGWTARKAAVQRRFRAHVTQALEVDDLVAIADDLARMKEGVDAMTLLPEHQQYVEELDEMQRELKSMTDSHLREALESHDMAKLSAMVHIYEAIDRAKDVRLSYLQSRRSIALKLANSYVDLGGGQSKSETQRLAALSEWLPGFFAEFAKWVRAECRWSASVFEGDDTLVATLLNSVLGAVLSKSQFRKWLNRYAHSKGDDALVAVLEIFQLCKDFSAMLHAGLLEEKKSSELAAKKAAVAKERAHAPPRAGAVENNEADDQYDEEEAEEAVPPASESAQPQPKLATAIILNVDWNDDLVHIMFDCFVPYLNVYHKLEDRMFRKCLTSLQLRSSNYDDGAQSIRTAYRTVLEACRAATQRCVALTQGVRADLLVESMKHVISSLADRLQMLLSRLHSGAGLENKGDDTPGNFSTAVDVDVIDEGGEEDTAVANGDGAGGEGGGEEEDDDDDDAGGFSAGTVAMTDAELFGDPSDDLEAISERNRNNGTAAASPSASSEPTTTNQSDNAPIWSSFQGAFEVLRAGVELQNELVAFDAAAARMLHEALDVAVRRFREPERLQSDELLLDERIFVCFHRHAGSVSSGKKQQKKSKDPVLATLSTLTEAATNEQFLLLPDAHDKVASFIDATDQLIFDSMYHAIAGYLRGFSRWKQWSAAAPANMNPDLVLPSFSLHHSDYVTHIGEHFFTLVQQLEPLLQQRESVDDAADDDDELRRREDVMYWLKRVAHKLMKDFVGLILRISYISPHGAKQLAADLQYLIKVLTALGIEPSLKVRRMKDLLLKAAADEELVAEDGDELLERLLMALHR